MDTDVSKVNCPRCGGAVSVPPLDDLVLRLINGQNLSENAEAVLRAIWAKGGRPVRASALFAALYDDDPDAEPPMNKLYAEVRDAVGELSAALAADDHGIAVVPVPARLGWRLDLSGAV